MINIIPDTTNVTPGMIGRLSIDSICSPPAKFHADGEYFIHAVHGLGGLVYGMGCPIGSGMTMRGRRTRIGRFGVLDRLSVFSLLAFGESRHSRFC